MSNIQDRLQQPGGRKKKVSLAVDTTAQASSTAPPGAPVVTDSSLRGDGISVGFAGLRINELAACAASASASSFAPVQSVQHTRDGGGSEGDRLTLSEFKTVKVLGEGTSGVVKLVRHKPTGRRYAMKVIQLGCSEQERKQILIEVKTLHKSDVPHIIAFTDAFYVDNAVHLILEYMDGGSLADVLSRRGPLPEPLLARARCALPHRAAPPRHATPPRHTTPRHATPRHTTPRHATPRHTTPHHATPRHATLIHTTPHHATPRHSASFVVSVTRVTRGASRACAPLLQA
jgi:hypothetical protein